MTLKTPSQRMSAQRATLPNFIFLNDPMVITYALRSLAFAGLLGLTLVACDDKSTDPASNPVQLKNQSVTPPLIKSKDVAGLEFFSLIGSDDTLAQSPSYIFGGSADGCGILKNTDGTFTLIVNQEDNYSVSRITLDKTFKPVKGEYLLNSDNGRWRLCSATMATPEEHGFGPTYLTCGESGAESMIHAINPLGPVGQSNPLPAFGHWSAENALPLPKDVYTGKTVIVITDDDSGPQGGQVALYVSNTVGDLNGGSLYALARVDNNMRETDMAVGQSYDVEFRKIDNQQSLDGAQTNAKTVELKAIQFGRVEDVDYRKGAGNGREVYFTVTGQDYAGANADKGRTKYGRVYRLTLNAADPTKGKLEVVLNGDDRAGIAGMFQNPDNICVTQNYVYVQEDPNGYGDETHDSYIYQYDIAARTLKIATELNHHRGETKYNGASDSKKGSWEYGGLIDISSLVGIDNTFLLAIQPHTWTGDRYKNPDGGTVRASENQASQMVIVKGLPR